MMTPRSALRTLLLLAVPGALLPVGTGAPSVGDRQREHASAPSLVVLIAVDQLRPDYLERYGGRFTRGLERLVREGAFFPNGVHDHATTETAPGHASMLSGRFPRGTGIVRNNRGVQDRGHPLLDAPGAGASPRRFRGTTLIDWIAAADSGSRVLSVSRKDRGAILPVGRSRQEVYWYASNGLFTTSTYYRDTLPSWVQEFNARRLPQRTAGWTWDLLRPESEYPEPERAGRDAVFPHRMPFDSTLAASSVQDFPWIDQITLALALEGIGTLRLGGREGTDVLVVSLSATDAVGHAFGPDSRELHDQLLRLDEVLGAFLDSLFAMVPPAAVTIALTSDHGVGPNPELHFGRPGIGRTNLDTLVARYRRELGPRGLPAQAFGWDAGILFTDPAAFHQARIDMDSTLGAFARDARRVSGVLRADLVRDLAAADTARDVIARRWHNSLPPDLGATLVVTLEPYHLWSRGSYATHGTPHDYDARVPIILYGPAFAPGRRDTPARVVDIAPTLAHVTGVVPAEPLDGRVLVEALRSPEATEGDRRR